ncbi:MULTISPECIES: hypothetical protein [Butyricimonas]|uniref:hypothetical protein n=1 Tax=Butyricimonas TaxID=574697 RepID=UPI0016522757|nr:MULTISPECIES: hypothetical protein [Butyricimonas]
MLRVCEAFLRRTSREQVEKRERTSNNSNTTFTHRLHGISWDKCGTNVIEIVYPWSGSIPSRRRSDRYEIRLKLFHLRCNRTMFST